MKRALALLLACCMLLLLVACNPETKDQNSGLEPDGQGTDPGGDTDKDAVDGEDDQLKADLPEKNYNDEVFRFYIGNTAFDYAFIVDEDTVGTGDLIDDAIYKRNLDIQDRFNIKLEFVRGGGTTGGETSATTNLISQWIQSGDDTYDVYSHVQHSGMPGLILQNMFIDWNELPYVDLDKPWWYQNIRRDISFGGKVYVMTGDLADYVEKSACLLFNKTLCDELGLDYPYDKVNNMEWTYDELLKMTQRAAYDINGDDVMTYEDDRYGLVGWCWEMLPALYIGMGQLPTVRNDNDMPALNMQNERTYKVLDNIVELFSGTNADVNWSNNVADTYGLCTGNMFREGRALFQDATLGSLQGYRDMEDDFGVVPYPMLDKEQGEYFSRSPYFTPLLYIPTTNMDLEKTSIILEAMSELSYHDLTPVVFDTVLTVKGTRDEESEGMLPLIRDSSRFMLDGFLGPGEMQNYIQKGANTFASDYASWEGKYLDTLDQMIEFYSK